MLQFYRYGRDFHPEQQPEDVIFLEFVSFELKMIQVKKLYKYLESTNL
jgi:hypothetical protein